MAKDAENMTRRGGIPWRVLGWGTAALLLLLPYVADAPWTASDFVFAAVMIGSVGLAFELIVHKSSSVTYRAGAVLAVVGAFLTVWVNGAVGMIGSEGNPYNLLFGGVLVVALAGAIVARFEPAGMARAMAVTAIAQAAVGAFGLSANLLGGSLSIAFAGLWVLAAALFFAAAPGRTRGSAKP